MARKPAGELTHKVVVEQHVDASGDPLGVVTPIIATYRHRIRGSLMIKVELARVHRGRWWVRLAQRLRIRSRPIYARTPIATRTLDGAEIFDNEPVDIPLDLHEPGEGCRYIVTLTGMHTSSGSAPTVWLSDGQERVPGHLGCHIDGRHQGPFGLDASTIAGPLVASSLVPPAILFSPVTQCNLNCIHCISRHTRTQLKKLSVPLRDQLRRYVRDGHISFICTDYSGDLLWADHRFGGELDYVYSLDVPFHVDTNGAYLTAGAVDGLLASKIASINISLDAATDANFRRVRKGAPPLEQVLRNIRHLVAMARQTGSSVRISMSFTLMASTLHEWQDFIRMAVDAGVTYVYTRHLEAFTQDMECESLWHDKQRYNEAIEPAVALANELGVTMGTPPAFEDRPERVGHRACPEPWRSAVILGNGDVAACCVPGMVMGNLHEMSLEDIWNGPRYQTLRKTVNSPQAPAPCQSCPMYRLPENRNSYLIFSGRKSIDGGAGEAPRSDAIPSAG